MRNIGLLSGRIKKNPSTNAAADRYDFIDLRNVEPDLGVPSFTNGIASSDTDGTRRFLYASTGLSINNLTGNITVNENTVAIDTTGFNSSTSTNLHDVLVDLDNAVNTTITFTDATIDGNGTVGDPLSIGQGVRPTDNVTFNDLIVSGDLTVNGTTTQINTTTLTVNDAVITLNSGQTAPLNDIGLVFQRYDPATTINYNVAIAWDETADRLIIGKTPEDGNDNDISFSSEWITILDDGKVGIGTAGPQELLHIEGAIRIDDSYTIDSDAAILNTVSQTQIASFDATLYGGAKFTIQAYDFATNERHITEINIVHDTITAYGSEFGTVYTGSAPLATYNVDLNSNVVRVLATGASTNTTRYKVQETLFLL